MGALGNKPRMFKQPMCRENVPYQGPQSLSICFSPRRRDTTRLETESPEGANLLVAVDRDWTELGQVGVTQVESIRKMVPKNLADRRD